MLLTFSTCQGLFRMWTLCTRQWCARLLNFISQIIADTANCTIVFSSTMHSSLKRKGEKNRFTCSWWNSNSQVYILFWILMIVLSTWGAHQCTVWREGIYTAELGATWADCKVEKHVYLRKQLTEVRIIHTGAWHIFLFVNELIT